MAVVNMTEAGRQAAERRAETVGLVMFNCTVCGTQSPFLEKHTCSLTDRQRRRLEAWQRSQHLPGTQAPPNCADCGMAMPTGPAQGPHACKGAPPSAPPGPVDQLVGQLRAAGYQISKESKP